MIWHLWYFLRIEVAYSNRDIHLSQHKYITYLIDETSILGCKPLATPIEPKIIYGTYEDSASIEKVDIKG